jgi:hypothetical protein
MENEFVSNITEILNNSTGGKNKGIEAREVNKLICLPVTAKVQ